MTYILVEVKKKLTYREARMTYILGQMEYMIAVLKIF
jgi:hypothetical protein